MIVLLGGITADRNAVDGWWKGLCAQLPARAILCPELPDAGPRGGAEVLADHVARGLAAIDAPPATVIGASLGGLVGLALAIRHPARVRHLVSISAGLRPDPWGTAIRHLQRRLVRRGEASFARQLGMLTYRGRPELAARFAPLRPAQDEPEVAAYLDHHGEAFARSFSPARYLYLSEVIDRTDLRAGLERITARVDVVGVPEDLIFPIALQRELVDALSAAGVRARLHVLDAPTGHDAFLTHQVELAGLLQEVL